MSTDPSDSSFSLLNLENSEFLKSQMDKPDLVKIKEKFKLTTDEKASAVLNFYKDIYFTLDTYSDRFTIDYLKANWTQVGLMNAYSATEVFTLNNVTSIRMQNKFEEGSYSCREVFNVNPYLEMCTHLDLNIEYFEVIKFFVSAFFNLDIEKDAREKIKSIMNQNDSFIEGLFGENSKVQFNLLIREVLEEVATDFGCGDSCRKVLAERQFVYSNVFSEEKVDSLFELPGNDDLLKYLPEVNSYTLKLLHLNYSSEGEDSEESATCDFLSSNVLNFNANSIFNVNQLSLFYTYAELNNKYNLLNFLKIRCDPDILLQTLEYFFAGWGLPNFYSKVQIKNVFQSYESPFLKKIKNLKEINGGIPDINTEIDFKILDAEFDFQAFTGCDKLEDLRKLNEINNQPVEDQNMSFIFDALLDYKNLKGVELLKEKMKLKSSSSSNLLIP